MKLPDIKHLSTKAKASLAVASIITIGATGVSLQQFQTSGAEVVPDIYTQVDDHEVRIDGLEGRQTTTEQKVDQNTTNIQYIQTTTSPTTASHTTQTVTQKPSSTTTAEPTVSEPAPAPAPEPIPDPRTITAVSESILSNGLRQCDYTLYDSVQDARQGVVRQNANQACLSVGDILPY